MIGTALKELRKRKGYNMMQMAAALNLPYTTYVNYEKNERNPCSEQLLLISKYFGVSLEYLLDRTDEKSSASDVPDAELNAKLLKVIGLLDDSQKELLVGVTKRLVGADNEQRRLFVRMMFAFEGLQPQQRQLFVELLESLTTSN